MIPDLSTYLEVLRGGTTVEKSTMAYLEIMDEIADRKDTSFFFLSAIHDFKVSGLVSAPFPALQPVTAQDRDSHLRATQRTKPDLIVSTEEVGNQ